MERLLRVATVPACQQIPRVARNDIVLRVCCKAPWPLRNVRYTTEQKRVSGKDMVRTPIGLVGWGSERFPNCQVEYGLLVLTEAASHKYWTGYGLCEQSYGEV